MIRKNLIKTATVFLAVTMILGAAGCGKKKTKNDVNSTAATQATVSAETISLASKELTKTGLVTFDYTDADGNTVKLEGKAVAGEDGNATIEVTDANGNKAVFIGKAKTVDGKLTVSDIKVKEAATLVKGDGTEIKIAADSKIEDANESDGNTESDIVASDDMKQEVSEAQEEEKQIEEAREEVKNTEAANVAENNGNGGNENNGGNGNDSGNAGNNDNGNNGGNNGSSDNGNGDSGNNGSGNNGNDSGNNGSSDNNNGDSGNNGNDNNGNGGNITPTEPVTPEPTPTPSEPATPGELTEEEKNPYTHPENWGTVDGPNGPQYSENSWGYYVRGQDVHQGADVACPYELGVLTTRYAFNNRDDKFEDLPVFYYIATDDEGSMSDADYALFEKYSDELHRGRCSMYKVGTFSCGEVWVIAYIS